MEKEKKRKSQQWIILVVYMIMGGVCGFIGMVYMEGIIGEDKGILVPILGGILTMLGLAVALFLHIIIHEAGHLVFGLLTGYRFCSFRIGSLMLVKKEDGYHWKKFSVMGTGGQCLMVPPEKDWKDMPYRLYHLGGVLFNILFSAAAFVFMYMISCPKSAQLALLLFIICGMGAAVANGIPMYGEINNDGANAWSLGKNPLALQSFALQLKINAQITREIRLKDMPDAWFFIPPQEEMERDALCSALGMMAFQRALDMQDFRRAKEIGKQLKALGKNLIGLYENLLINDLVFLELINEEPVSEEEEKQRALLYKRMEEKEFVQFAEAMKNHPGILRTRYAWIKLQEKKEEEAEEILHKFERLENTYPNRCEIEGEWELIQKVQKKYKKMV